MTDKKFTDEEIKKVLADWKYNLCVSCDKDDCEHCVAHLLGQSLDLINRYEAEIEKLTSGATVKAVGGIAELIEKQQAEIERLETNREHSKLIIQRLKKKIFVAKSEAIKEFAERLKEAPIKCNIPWCGLSTKSEIEEHFNDIMMQVKGAIDTVAEEMMEEQKC